MNWKKFALGTKCGNVFYLYKCKDSKNHSDPGTYEYIQFNNLEYFF